MDKFQPRPSLATVSRMDISPGQFELEIAEKDDQHSTPKITVIIPTRNRKTTLRKALLSYQFQISDPADYDMIIVDDGSVDGTSEDVAEWIDEFPFHVELITQPPGGPARARNRAIRQAKGELVLITGDDIIPHQRMIQAHLDAHRDNHESHIAVLGFIDWHPDLQITDFMDYITKVDGHQFAYHHITDPNDVNYGYFYTSNISLKTSFLKQSDMFSEQFRFAACEDIELGYRLKQRGMRMIFVSEAIGYHLHPMDLESFSHRQFRVGQMMALLLHLHPGILDVPPPPPPEDTLEKISAVKCNLDELESAIADRPNIPPNELEQIRQLRFSMYREIIYGYQALGLCEERRLQGFK